MRSIFQVLGTLFALVAPAVAAGGGTVEFQGMCDASGAVVVGKNRFLVADDEDSVLRVYDVDKGGAPVAAIDIAPALELPVKKKTPETDLEAATRIGPHALWLTSHGRNSKGKKQPSRLRFFATTIPEGGGALALEGRPYTGLLEDLLAAPALARFGLREAEARAPKEPGGLNLEGMTARPDGKSVVIGFRNPVPGGRALIVSLLNPLELLRDARARLGEPMLVDLQGRGVRSISFWRGRYLIVGGGISDEKTSALYTWDGRSGRGRPIAGLSLDGWNPEAFVSYPHRSEVLLLSDDGSRPSDGVACKDLPEAGRKRFRGLWVKVP
jgi:hypothetical protein